MELLNRAVLWVNVVLVAAIAVACQTTTNPMGPKVDYSQANALVDNCRLKACTSLNLDGKNLADFSVLNDLDHLEILMVSYTQFDDLSDISNLTQLKELHIGSTKVTDLSGLSQFPQLELLHIQSVEATDYTAISAISGLKELAVGSKTLTTLSFAKNLNNLKTLFVSNAKIENGSNLAELKQIETLELNNPGFFDLEPLLSMKSLQSVNAVFLKEYDDISNTQSGGLPDETISAKNETTIKKLRQKGVKAETEELTMTIVC